MKATEAKLLEFLKKSPQFVIPIYQRTYSWGERECRQLWEGGLSVGRAAKLNGAQARSRGPGRRVGRDSSSK